MRSSLPLEPTALVLMSLPTEEVSTLTRRGTPSRSTMYLLMSAFTCGWSCSGRHCKTEHSSHLCNKKVGIIDDRVPLLYSLEGGWARAVASTLRGLLLGRGIHRLPPSKPSWQVCTRHPNLIPDMEVPVANA